jgi:tRNA (guanine-N7-)-methyltransferase
MIHWVAGERLQVCDYFEQINFCGGTMDRNISRTVFSSQSAVHPRLVPLLEKHSSKEWQGALHRPSVEAFEALEEAGVTGRERIVLDSGCGTGESTLQLARAMPDCLVIGVDKSEARLSRLGASFFPHRQDNAVWLRAELSTFWRLALAAGWRLHRHYLLYPNPWPKPGQLQRRWHAHPVFPVLLSLGGRLELRCNWEIYVLEFALAVNRLLGLDVQPQQLPESMPVTPFERKYRASGHSLYSLVVSCDSGLVK